MTDINPITRPQQTTLDSVSKPTRQSEDSTSAARNGDRVELSAERFVDDLHQFRRIGIVQLPQLGNTTRITRGEF